MKSILQQHRSSLALVIGNGINLYGDDGSNVDSWADLLVSLAEKRLPARLQDVPDGVSLTEFYDILELQPASPDVETSLQKEFCDLMADWQTHEHHERVVEWAQEEDVPILTTNFEQTLSNAGKCSLRRTTNVGRTDFYPWESYYGSSDILDPGTEFGIWHVNGMQHYHRSVRLGLTHYMGSVERARGWLHKGNERRLFSGKNVSEWRGAASWLHIIFNTPLLIFGLSLDENEVFLRWLLIERARYFKRFPDRSRDAWYVHVGELTNDGKKFFLEGVGVHLISVNGYDEIYGAATWG